MTDRELHVPGAEAGRLLRRAVSDYDTDDALRTVARVAAVQAAGGAEQRRMPLPGHQLAMVVRALLEDTAGQDCPNRWLEEADLGLLCGLAVAAISSEDSAFGVEAPPNAWSWTHRNAYQGLPDRDRTHVPRSLILYRDLAPGLQAATGFTFESDFANAYRTTPDEAWTASYALYRRCLDTGGDAFGVDDLTADSRFAGIDRRTIVSVLDMLSCDYDKYRSMLAVPDGRHPHFEPYNLNPLRKYPLLQMPGGSYLVPLPDFLMRRVTHGLYYDLIELDRAGYIKLIGQAFNAYVGSVLEPHGAVSLDSANGGPWLVSDESNALIIRSITRPFGALGRATGDREHLAQDLVRSGGVVDCVVRLQDLMANPATGGPHASDIQGRRSIGLLVALEDFYLANGRLIRGIVDEELRRRGLQPMGERIQLGHIAGLESLGAVSEKANIGLTAAMAEKSADDDLHRLELDDYAAYLALRSQTEPRNPQPRLLADAERRHLDTV